MANNYSGVSWNANQPFYEHMRHEVWDRLREADKVVNESEGVEKLNALENIHSTVKHWYNMIQFYCKDDSDALLIEELFQNIETLTHGQEFSMANLNSEQNYAIRELLDQLRKLLWLQISKNGMTPSRRDTSGNEVWM